MQRRNAELNVESRPSPGAVTVCLYCGAVMRFGELELVVMAPKDIAELPLEMRLALCRAAYAAGRIRGEMLKGRLGEN